MAAAAPNGARHGPRLDERGPDPARVASAAGLVLFGAGALGVGRALLRWFLSLSFGTLLSLSLLLFGTALLLVSWAVELSREPLRVQVHRFLQQQLQVGQRIWLFCNMPPPSAADMQSFVEGVSPTLAVLMVQKPWDQLKIFAERWLNPARCATEGAASSEAAEATDLDLAMAWLRRPQLALGYDEQLELYGLAQQAQCGDCAAEAGVAAKRPSGPLARAKRFSWQAQRGVPRPRAAERLARRLAELDPGFSGAHPRLAAVAAATPAPTPSADILRLLCEMLQRKVPADLDERGARAKRRAAALVAVFGAMLLLWRSPRGREARRRLGQQLGPLRGPLGVGVWLLACLYAVALNCGLPPALHACLPRSLRALRALPAVSEHLAKACVGGPAPGLCRWAAQLLVPPVAGSLFRG